MKKSPQRKGIIYTLTHIKILHQIVRNLGIYPLVNQLLKSYPIKKQVDGITYRINSIAAFPLAEEIFSSSGCYWNAIPKAPEITFCDLGCNAGWFPLLIKRTNPQTNPIGLLIDADPNMIQESQWHLTNNQLTQCEPLLGAVGCPNSQTEIQFFINPANTQSSTKPFGESHPYPLKGKIQKIKVPTRCLQFEWESRHKNLKIDILKIDIEGSELDFLKKEIGFLKEKVKTIVCEWHTWHVSLQQIQEFLEPNQFSLKEIAETDSFGGVAIFTNNLNPL